VTATTWQPQPGRSLRTAEICIVGGGGIATCLLDLLVPFGPRTTVFNASGQAVPGATWTYPATELAGRVGDFDIVVLAAPLTAATHHLVNADLLSRMKDEAWVVNVARGLLVDTNALVTALESGQIGGAALDVTDPEPLSDGHPLWRLPNCIVTPHVAGALRPDRDELRDRIRENLHRFVTGAELVGLIDGESKY
jgi:D-3-phosphoglycerate dehydrogenase